MRGVRGVSRGEEPFSMAPYDAPEGMLFEERWIETDREKARRVARSLGPKISPWAESRVRLGFLTCLEKKEIWLLRYLRLGFSVGKRIEKMLTDETVRQVEKAVKTLEREAHAMIEFLRFSEYGGALVAVIEPKNRVLSLLAGHFCDRFPDEVLLIWDKTHKEALLWGEGKRVIGPMEEFVPPEASEEEWQFRRLWKRFFDAVAIEERTNPACQRNHMPLRYRTQMIEQQMPCSFPEEEAKRRQLRARRAQEGVEAAGQLFKREEVLRRIARETAGMAKREEKDGWEPGECATERAGGSYEGKAPMV